MFDELTRPYKFRTPFEGGGFALLLYVVDKDISKNEQIEVSDAIVEQGCRYAVCAGHKCGDWDDMIDWSVLERNNFKSNDETDVMTSWHENESIKNIVYFFINNTNYGNFEAKNLYGVTLGSQKGLMEEIKEDINNQLYKRI